MRPEPDAEGVVVVTSRPAAEGERAFEVEGPEDLAPPELPSDVRHESDMVERFRDAGFRLTMVGGGSRPDQVRRFYFRPP